MTFPFPIFSPRSNTSDPYFSSVSLLCHFDGSDAATTTTDSSSNSHTLTATGNVQLDTAQSVFGGSASLHDGSGDYWSIPDHNSLDLGTGAFTIEFRLRMASTAALGAIISKGNGTVSGQWDLVFNSGSPHLTFLEGGVYRADSANNSIAANTWYACCIERSSGGVYQFYINGVASGTGSTSAADLSNTAGVRIGSANGSGFGDINGWIDEMRITKGVARYGGNYTPATVAFPDS